MKQSIVQISTLLLLALVPIVLESQNTTVSTAPSGSYAAGTLSRGVFVAGSGFIGADVYAITRQSIKPAITRKPISLVKQGRSVLTSYDGTSTTTIDEIKWERDSEGKERVEVDREEDGSTRVLYVIITDPIKQVYLVLDSYHSQAQIIHPPKAPPQLTLRMQVHCRFRTSRIFLLKLFWESQSKVFVLRDPPRFRHRMVS